ncbi:arginyl-tRNA synthetase [Bifidobacterium commune]|uniref:Arginine--tRNA ligase n=1 Tax=Bifidobacterium commune TaxID=1505727 RepID=A0A1C4H539_9BIFI|nr:arginine--tRNA ligase [Bifidobacterium commune]MBB2955682.1 arginyl-tRNA synthetase [Bifidobacterium commune]SCC80037.1 arginyl-tRNA synthetase [Bifidobacterium commune]
MNPEVLSELISDIAHGLVEAGAAGDLTTDLIPPADKLAVMRPKDRAHGDWSSNVAMQLAKKAGMNPRALAEAFAAQLRDADGIASVEVAGPGFINITLDSASAAAVVSQVLDKVIDVEPVDEGTNAGAGAAKPVHSTTFGLNNHLNGKTLNLEFVSANPTGPIHIGGVRWAATGDSMARVLEANGAKVVREYYFNDHGEQINRFAKSLVAAAHGEQTPVDGYKGAYINEIADRVIAEAKADGVDVLALPRVDAGKDENGESLGEGNSQQREEFRKRAVPMMFAEIQQSMKEFRVNFDVWFHENSLYKDGAVEEAIDKLREKGDIYKKEGATWFASTKHGDDKDRVILKSNGEYAYFAADIAYYYNKRHRDGNPSAPADVAIYMLGADHHGYIGRMMAMCDAFGDKPGENMQILIGQLVNVMKDGKTVRMSKRAGNVVTIDDLVDAVGVDAARYSLARTDYNTSVDIDLDVLASHTNENPVYYVQYAHARSCNVDRNAEDAKIDASVADLSLLDTPADGEVLGALAQWPSVVSDAGDLRAPHKIAHYLEALAGTYHKWYNLERVVPMELTDLEAREGDGQKLEAMRIAKTPEPARAAARLQLNDAVQRVIAAGLDMLGVSAPDRM